MILMQSGVTIDLWTAGIPFYQSLSDYHILYLSERNNKLLTISLFANKDPRVEWCNPEGMIKEAKEDLEKIERYRSRLRKQITKYRKHYEIHRNRHINTETAKNSQNTT